MNLDEQTAQRQARLAALRRSANAIPETHEPHEASPVHDGSSGAESDAEEGSLAFRNFDPATKGVRPHTDSGEVYLREQAQALEAEVLDADEEGSDEDAEKDTAALQGRRPNWDLKRDLQALTEPLKYAEDRVILAYIKEHLKSGDSAEHHAKSAKTETDSAEKGPSPPETDSAETGPSPPAQPTSLVDYGSDSGDESS